MSQDQQRRQKHGDRPSAEDAAALFDDEPSQAAPVDTVNQAPREPDEQREFPHDFRNWDLKREDYVAPPTRGTDSQHDAGLIGYASVYQVESARNVTSNNQGYVQMMVRGRPRNVHTVPIYTTPRFRAEGGNTCICGAPETTGTIHRTDGPCFISEAASPERSEGTPDLSKLPRYEPAIYAADAGEMLEHADGQWFRATDVQALLATPIPTGEKA